MERKSYHGNVTVIIYKILARIALMVLKAQDIPADHDPAPDKSARYC
jgi:hypothetical protein